MTGESGGLITTITDEDCFKIKDIAKYLQKEFRGRENVPLEEVWNLLVDHPVFPADGFKPQIKSDLVNNYGAVTQQKVNPLTRKKEYTISFKK